MTGRAPTPLPVDRPVASVQRDGVSFAGRPANATTITKVRINQAFVLAGSVADCSKWALSPAEFTAATLVPIDGGDVFGGEENLHQASPNL
jgi:hypothetical protein